MLAYESKVQPSIKCLSCCVKFSMCKMQTLNTPTPGAAGSPETETELECSARQVEPATGTDTFKWENNSTVQSVRVILTLRVQDYLRMRHISPPLARADVQKCVCAACVARFLSTVVTCSLMALISSSSCCLLWPPFRWSWSFRDCS